MNEDSRDELYSMLHEIMLSDYEFTRNYRNFLEVSRSYFTSSATNNRNMHAILNRIMNIEQYERQTPTPTPTQRPPPIPAPNPTPNPTQRPLQNIYTDSRNHQRISNTTNFMNRLNNPNSFLNGLWGNSNTHPTQPSSVRQNGTRNRHMNSSSIITLLSNSLLQNELLNSHIERERMPTEEEINNACEVLLYRDCSNNNNNQTRCPIDMIDFEPDDSIMRITHCGHIFREANLRRNFQTSTNCPMCRHNIIQSNTENTNTFRNNQNRENNQINQTTENSNNIINTIMNQIRNNPNTVTGNDSFLDASGNNVSVEYSVSTHFI